MKYLTGATKMLWFYIPQKQKVCYLPPGKNSSFARLSLILVSKTVTLSKFMSNDTLALSSTLNLVGDPTLPAHAKQSQKPYLLSRVKHFVNTSKEKLFYHAHILPHLTYTSTVWDGCSNILFHKLISLHRRAAKLIIPELSLTTDAKLQPLGLLPLGERRMLNKAMRVFRAYRNLAPQYLKDLFICHNSRAAQTQSRPV